MRRGLLVLVAALATSSARAQMSAPIVNGVETAAYPAVGALLSPSDPDRAGLVCTGTLIGCHTFLTAAHCVEGASPAAFVVYFQHAGFFAVSAIATHPSFAFPEADVAVLTLSGTVTGVAPIPIDAVGGHPSGTPGSIVGFGRTGGTASDYGLKRSGTVDIAPCTNGVSDTTSICWQFTAPIGLPGDDSNTCNGDSGGPLFIDPGSGAVTAGITSGGSSATCLANDASFDARVSTYASYVLATGAGDVGVGVCSSLPTAGGPDTITTAMRGVLGAVLPQATHSFVVPAGTDRLRVTMNAVDDGSDFDLYVRAGAPPTTGTYDCGRFGPGQFAACDFPAPAAGTWHVLVDRFAGSGGYQVTATTFGTPCAEPGTEGAPCDDGNACTSDEICVAGACIAGTTIDCDDGIACTADACVPSLGCVHTPVHQTCGTCAACDPVAGCVVGPRPDCRPPTVPGASLLKLTDGRTDASDLIVWKWTKGAATSPADLGAPQTTTDYHLCVFDESGTESVLALAAAAPAGGVCGPKACWTVGSAGFKYRNSERTPDGISRLVVKAGDAGRAKIALKGKGATLPPLPPLPLALPARVQLQADGAGCFEASFGPAGAIRNDGQTFVGRGE